MPRSCICSAHTLSAKSSSSGRLPQAAPPSAATTPSGDPCRSAARSSTLSAPALSSDTIRSLIHAFGTGIGELRHLEAALRQDRHHGGCRVDGQHIAARDPPLYMRPLIEGGHTPSSPCPAGPPHQWTSAEHEFRMPTRTTNLAPAPRTAACPREGGASYKGLGRMNDTNCGRPPFQPASSKPGHLDGRRRHDETFHDPPMGVDRRRTFISATPPTCASS